MSRIISVHSMHKCEALEIAPTYCAIAGASASAPQCSLGCSCTLPTAAMTSFEDEVISALVSSLCCQPAATLGCRLSCFWAPFLLSRQHDSGTKYKGGPRASRTRITWIVQGAGRSGAGRGRRAEFVHAFIYFWGQIPVPDMRHVCSSSMRLCSVALGMGSG